MCGRLRREWSEMEIAKEMFTQTEIADELNRIKITYNASPGQHHAIVVQDREGINRLRPMHWGLIRPGWKNGDPKPSNARAESILRKDLFRDLVATKRCLVPINGYYEWRIEDGRKIPYTIRATDRRIVAIAAIYDAWRNPDGSTTESYCMITTTPAPEIAHIHDRMPVILQSWEDEQRWLSRSVRDLREIVPLLRPYPGEHLECWAVSDLVNNTRNDGPELVLPRSEIAPTVELKPMAMTLPLAMTA